MNIVMKDVYDDLDFHLDRYTIKSSKSGQTIQKMYAMIRYHLHIEPKDLSNEDLAEVWCGLEWMLEQERQANNKK
jgi:hypothetical protein